MKCREERLATPAEPLIRQTPSSDPLKPLLVILGPTGSGKSSLALTLAQRFGGEIINCDSVQLYKGFDIGAAKLPVSGRGGIPHHLLDIAGVGDDFTAGDYSRTARKVLDDVTARGKLPIVCGGSGLYLRALLAGLSPAPPRNEELRARLTKVAARRPSSLHYLLKRADARAAARIHPNDHQKLVRALEMVYLEGSAASQIQERTRDQLTGYDVFKIGLSPDRQQLYCRLNARAAEIFANGLLDETRQLLALGYSPASKPMQSLGYLQAVKTLSGHQPLEQSVQECQTKTRQYAKRQFTWFRAEPGVHWLYGFGGDSQVIEDAIALARRRFPKPAPLSIESPISPY